MADTKNMTAEAVETADERKPLLSVKDLRKAFPIKKSLTGKVQQELIAVDNVSFDLYPGETLGIVGESGCGKTTLGRTILKLHPSNGGQIIYDGNDITSYSKTQMRSLRTEMQIIFQDPYASLNPRMNVEKIISEPLITHKIYPTKEATRARVIELMQEVGIPVEFIHRYPHQFSGGQRQRIGIARALALQPKLIVCDEPVSALDVSIQSQVLNLLDDLQEQYKLTYLFISHDLSVVRHISDRVCVMFLGCMCEIGNTDEIYEKPMHPYTKFLLDSVPQPDPTMRDDDKELLTGEIPSPVNPPSGCRFRTRCPYATEKCAQEVPELQDIGGRKVACHYPLNV